MTSLRLSDAHPVEWQTARCGRTLDIRPGEHVGPESGHLAGSGSRTSIANCVRQAGHSRTVSGCSGNAAGSSASSTRRPLTSPPPGAPHRPSPQLQPAHNVAGVERPGSATTGARTWPLLRSLPLVIDRSVARSEDCSKSTGLRSRATRCARDRVYPHLGRATIELSAGPRDIEEPSTTALALDPPQTLLGGDVDAWCSVRTPRCSPQRG